jgi:hypothetical protein
MLAQPCAVGEQAAVVFERICNARSVRRRLDRGWRWC